MSSSCLDLCHCFTGKWNLTLIYYTNYKTIQGALYTIIGMHKHTENNQQLMSNFQELAEMQYKFHVTA